jgi:uncharacterized lipoprotein YddW (UPF0748 family)
MRGISRRDFINVTGILGGAILLPSFLHNDIYLPTDIDPPWYFQSWYLKVQSKKCRTRINAEAQLQEAKLAGIDTIIYNVHENGAHYNSAFYTRCSDIEAGFDPLGYLVQRGNEMGINIFAWICPGVDCIHFDPTWNIAGKYGAPLTLNWLDFSIPDARERVRDIAIDITSKYTVGIMLDYIRYKEHEYWSPGNHPELSAQDITTTVTMVQSAIVPRQLNVSVRAHDYKGVLQDWFSWLRLGIVDRAITMSYAYRAGQISAWYYQWDTDIPLDRIVPCLSLYDLHISPPVIKTTAELLAEIDECKALNLDTLGFAFFDSDGLDVNNRSLIKSSKFKNHNNQLHIPF